MKNWRGKAVFGVSLVICGVGAFSSFSGCTSEPTNVISGGAGTSATGTGSAGTSATGAAGTSATGASGTGAAGTTTAQAGTSGGAGDTGTAGTSAAGTSGGAGTGAAGTAAGGTTGAGGTAAGAICTPMSGQFDCNNVLTGMDGYLNRDDANGPSQGSDAIQLNCTTSDVPNMQKIYKEKHWQLKGPGIMAGKMYKVDLHIYGVVECKTYVGGTGPAKTASETLNVNSTYNLWLAGSRDNGDHWNTYAFTVTPTTLSTLVGIGPQTGMTLPQTANTYVINQCPGNRAEGHFTFSLDFPASITVPGESWINYIEYDTNCRLIANCGAAEATQTCPGPYNIVNTVKMSVPNTNAQFAQPIANTANPPSRGQWWYVDVAGVTAM